MTRLLSPLVDTETPLAVTRREFGRLLLVAGIGVAFGGCTDRSGATRLSPEWWVELHTDGRIRMLTKRVEMGQGAHVGLRTLLAEELDVQPDAIEIVQVVSDAKYGEIITGGSFTLAGWQERMRRAGATARHMLLEAAARSWRVPFGELATFEGTIEHAASGRKVAYREMVELAAQAPPPSPEAVHLKPQHAWRYIGKRTPMPYHPQIVSGRAQYGIDMRLPGMCFAVLERAPVLGARLIEFDDSDARRVKGFIATVALRGNRWPSEDHCRDAVAVVATNSWAAQQARDAVHVSWDYADAPLIDSATISNVFEEHIARPGIVSFERGDMNAPLESEALYHQPYLAHAPMEPPNATARFEGGRLEVWSGTQRQTRLQKAIVRELGIKAEDVIVHATLIGGSFGRRLEIDYGLEAAKLAQQLSRPVQVLWTRAEDLKFGLYRSGSLHRLRAAMDRDGRISHFEHRCVAESVMRQQQPAEITPDGADWTIATPLISLLYDVPNVRVEHHAVKPMVPCAWWRGTYWTQVTTAVECFMDELAERSAQDPLTLRLRHLESNQKREFVVNDKVRVPFDPARMRGVLNAVAASCGWNQSVAAGHARGLACGIYDSPECHAAVIAEARMVNGVPRLVAAYVAVDVGVVVNPEVVKAQAIGGFLMGASAALKEGLTWRAGRVQQSGFADYPILRMQECPRVEVVLVPSDSGICGVGEIVTPAAIAAVSNAVSRLTGNRIRRWPIL